MDPERLYADGRKVLTRPKGESQLNGFIGGRQGVVKQAKITPRRGWLYTVAMDGSQYQFFEDELEAT